MNKSKIAVTMGDPAGIGPEIICKTLLDSNFNKKFELIIIGFEKIINDTFKKILKVNKIPAYKIIEPTNIKVDKINYSEINALNGKLSMLCVEKAVEMIQNNMLDAMCTCPIHKKAIQLAGYKYSGHTEFLGDLTGSTDFSMMLMGDKIKVILVTTHTPIKDIANSITKEKILKAIKNAHKNAKFFAKDNPKIAVCGLNPHAGDFGAIGDEEELIILPAIKEAQSFADVSGPYSADALFPKVLKDEFDFVIVMYHDQGLIPVKMESFGNAVNVTLNLPIIRTSVDHGTAFDIAGKNIADNGSLKRAIEVADLMVKNA
jgi:4-hydroxythreonine-4-phosphate dehydrogenase